MSKVRKNQYQDVLDQAVSWKQAFKSSVIRVGFNLNLTRAMLELLCSIADDVRWDRATFGDIHQPDNWIATMAALAKRGLTEELTGAEREAAAKANDKAITTRNYHDLRNYCRLTPAGLSVVELLKVTGLFIVQDNAIYRKHKRA